jgi:ribosome-associated protein
MRYVVVPATNTVRVQPAKDAYRLIRTTTGGAAKRASTAKSKAAPASASLLADIVTWLDDAKAEEIVTIPLEGKSSLGDYMVVASGRTDRHVGAIADQIAEKVKTSTGTPVRVEGVPACDWVLIDTGDIIVHVFRPEVREFYNLEKMWKAELPPDTSSVDPSQH